MRRKRLFRGMRLLGQIDPEPTFMAVPVDSRGGLLNQSPRRLEMGAGAIQTARQHEKLAGYAGATGAGS